METTTRPRSIYDRLRWRHGEIESPDGRLSVHRFTVEKDSLENLRLAWNGGRQTRPGDYHALVVDGCLWMSDTDAECRDHSMPVYQADRHPGGKGLVNGLGMGLVVEAMLDTLGHVDVVENDPLVIEHIGAPLVAEYGDRLTIHHADAFTIKWETGRKWDVAWHDIWPTLSAENLPEMGTLHRRYGRRVGWQGSWGKEVALYDRRRWG